MSNASLIASIVSAVFGGLAVLVAVVFGVLEIVRARRERRRWWQWRRCWRRR